MNSYRIRTSSMLGSHWSATSPSTCTRWIECCGNSDSYNRFRWHLRCSMMSTKSTYGDWVLWQTIFALGREEALANPCRKGMMWSFKSKDKGWREGPINSAHAITGLNGASDGAHTTAPSDYARCVS
ncbi:hypothetical protein PVK06_026263 [Gossypium arboreum]|uniref:Uncharacterized protein n=1 Tax=Gossypium arboreum TaxID=29729 RepID=A0ABR0NX80_GOSAR|nr:hypothetical protein PVK06_026263 [Gossypium arboreum]